MPVCEPRQAAQNDPIGGGQIARRRLYAVRFIFLDCTETAVLADALREAGHRELPGAARRCHHLQDIDKTFTGHQRWPLGTVRR